MTAKNEIQELIDVKTTMINMPNVLKENITNIPTETLFVDIITFISNIENKLNITIEEKKKVGLILHIAFAISRLANKEEMVGYTNKNCVINDYKNLYSIVKDTCTLLENNYLVNFSDDEICYIISFIIN